jgi:hypothetical protein
LRLTHDGGLAGCVGTAERKDDTLDGECGRKKPTRSWIGLFQKDDFGPGSTGEVRGELQVDGSGGETQLEQSQGMSVVVSCRRILTSWPLRLTKYPSVQ